MNSPSAQGSRWRRDRLLEVGEFGQYDPELKEAWERFFLPADDDDGAVEEEAMRRKGAVQSMTYHLAAAGGPHRIRANVILPGLTLAPRRRCAIGRRLNCADRIVTREPSSQRPFQRRSADDHARDRGGGVAAAAPAARRDQGCVIGDVLVDTGIRPSAGKITGSLEGGASGRSRSRTPTVTTPVRRGAWLAK